MQNKACSNGTLRTECIKVRRASPEGSWANDTLDVHRTWHDLGGGGGHGRFTRTDTLSVHT